MKIKLYGTATCSRCKIAKMMLDKRNIKFDYREVTNEEYKKSFEGEIPQLTINGQMYQGKNALLKIRKLKHESK